GSHHGRKLTPSPARAHGRGRATTYRGCNGAGLLTRIDARRIWRHARCPPYAIVNANDLKKLARPLEESRHLDPLLDRIGDARFVLLGEATHGPSEFYTWRTEVSKRLLAERGFSFLDVEGDWPD